MSAMSKPFSALYLHIPFCVKRCAYCDFATEAVPRGSERIDDFVERMVISIRRAAATYKTRRLPRKPPR